MGSTGFVRCVVRVSKTYIPSIDVQNLSFLDEFFVVLDELFVVLKERKKKRERKGRKGCSKLEESSVDENLGRKFVGVTRVREIEKIE